jgi:hypothetical protein
VHNFGFVVLIYYDARSAKHQGNQLCVTDLYSVFRKIRLQGQHLPRIHVRVVRFFEGLLQLLQLIAREDGSEKETRIVVLIMTSDKVADFQVIPASN